MNCKVGPSPQEGPIHALFDIYEVDPDGSVEWLASVQSHSVALLKIELTAVEAPGDYVIVNRQTGDRTELSVGLSVDRRQLVH